VFYTVSFNYLSILKRGYLYLLFVVGLVVSSCSQTTVTTDDSFEGVELPDGSIVLLNRNSSISYDEDFDPRHINLTGEAYFKVTTVGIPFTVATTLGEVAVLGTKFDIISSDDELEVEVESGKVELKTDTEERELSRGQRAKFTKNNNEIELDEAKYKFRIWLKELDIEFKKMGKELKQEGKKLDKRLKDMN
jgi:transmembrane sensor